MIRALIVDDEKITRKGMLSVIPWERYGIQIVEDLGSATSALAWLSEHPVDLVFVDVAMPGMNGIDLMREMRKRGLECAVVVLTFYDDFEYIREAMRLGAVDYLLKTQLDDQKILEMLERVTRKVREAGEARTVGRKRPLVLVDPAGAREAAAAVVAELSLDPGAVVKIGDGSVLLELDRAEGSEAQISAAARRHGVVLVRLTGASAHLADDLAANGESLRALVFYECGREETPFLLSMDRLQAGPPPSSPEQIEQLRLRWSSPDWLLVDGELRDLEELTNRYRPPVTTMMTILSAARRELAAAFPALERDLALPPGAPPATWSEWRPLLEGIRNWARQRIRELRHSEEVVRKVLAAVAIIRRTDGRFVKEESVAAQVGLSRSYFSHCFKDVTGAEFKKFLIDKSIAEAKDLLVRTAEPFRRISARLGYQSEGHFSRTFRASTGLTPREFRIRHHEGEQH